MESGWKDNWLVLGAHQEQMLLTVSQSRQVSEEWLISQASSQMCKH